MKSIDLAVVLGLLSGGAASAQTNSKINVPKVTITNIGFYSPDAQGFYNNVSINLQGATCRDHIPVSYQIQTSHVKLPSEALEKIRPQIADIERDLAKDCEVHR